jgi:hypothetical protein
VRDAPLRVRFAHRDRHQAGTLASVLDQPRSANVRPGCHWRACHSCRARRVTRRPSAIPAHVDRCADLARPRSECAVRARAAGPWIPAPASAAPPGTPSRRQSLFPSDRDGATCVV